MAIEAAITRCEASLSILWDAHAPEFQFRRRCHANWKAFSIDSGEYELRRVFYSRRRDMMRIVNAHNVMLL